MKKDKAASNLICTAPKNSLLFFHNHPKNSCFSEKDLESFMISDAIKMMSVVCNNGRLYYLIKMDTFDKCEALMHYETIYSKIESGSVKEFLRTCSKIGLKFIYGGHVQNLTVFVKHFENRPCYQQGRLSFFTPIYCPH